MNAPGPTTFGPYEVSIDSKRPFHAVIRRMDGAPPEPTFYELQHMKSLAFGSEAIAVEVFPRAGDLKDTANQRHLWSVPSQVRVPNLAGDPQW